MSIRDNLALDHFYISATPEEFADLLLLQTYLKTGVDHHVVKASDDQWEGLYLDSRPGSPFEILRDRRPGFLGLAFQTTLPTAVDAARIVTEEIPGIARTDWHISSRTTDDGQPWFDSIRLSADPITRTTLYDPWIMKYHLRHRENPSGLQPRVIDRFNAIQLSLGRDYIEEIRRKSAFFPDHSVKIAANSIDMQITDRDGYKFEIHIRLVDVAQRFVFESISFDLYHRHAAEVADEPAMKHFVMKRSGLEVRLSRRN